VNIDGKQKAEGVNPEMVGMQMQRGYASKVRQFIQVLMDNTQIDDYRAQRF
jgi:hypothetical protein